MSPSRCQVVDGFSVDLFGERVSDPAAAGLVVEAYIELAGALPPPPADVWLSVDLSHLALVTDSSAVADRLAAIARPARWAARAGRGRGGSTDRRRPGVRARGRRPWHGRPARSHAAGELVALVG